ncbi:RHS repeat-associated core domain-containing protein [Pseudomonas sp. LJDD11]|uniref:RHS repeat-associated core domain-containing protein n=1 Tax=Pseudomonas sp. LJDD11 TaxID=2931984 RepID=UPI00211C00D4|nr:RHS repeat-associated core domain-containing protein [Pseudomonas sp. LJDD11]
MAMRIYRYDPLDRLARTRSLAADEHSSPGFNGELPDPLTGHYLLGHGYRADNPVLMRFNSPDSLSPFAEGGINAYAYCRGDPVNRCDPTGHADFFGDFWRDVMPILGMVVPLITSGVLYKFTKPRIAKLRAGNATTGDKLVVAGSAAVAASAIVGIAGTVVRYVVPESNAGHALGALALLGTGAFSGMRYAGLKLGKVAAPASSPIALAGIGSLPVRRSIIERSVAGVTQRPA